MTFLEQLQSHRGGLIRLKELYWYTGRGWDESPGRICLVLDIGGAPPGFRVPVRVSAGTRTTTNDDQQLGVALLLIDDCTHWVRVVHEDVEIL